MISIERAETPEDFEAVRVLIRGFVRWTMAEIAATDNPAIFAGLETELAGLPGRYGPPTGCLVLARLDGEPVGCVAFYAHDASTIEVKRMFVLPQARGHGIGGRMIEVLLAQARATGFLVQSPHHARGPCHLPPRRLPRRGRFSRFPQRGGRRRRLHGAGTQRREGDGDRDCCSCGGPLRQAQAAVALPEWLWRHQPSWAVRMELLPWRA